MTSHSAYQEIKGILTGGGVEDAAFEANTLMEAVTGHSRFILDNVEPEDWELLQAMAKRRSKREPLQYLLGQWPFLGIQLKLGPGVLVPRPETEEVCVAAGGLLAAKAELFEWPDAPRALDLCSGTGALALGLQSFVPSASVTAVELSGEAFGYLEQNIDAFRLGQAYENVMAEGYEELRVPQAIQADALTYYKKCAANGLDVIVCNPPYVTEAEYTGLAPELYFEPKQALVPTGQQQDDGLLFYRAIARDYRQTLKPGGWLVFEIGAGQGGAVQAILQQNGYAGIEVRKDLAGHDRIALAQKPQQA